MDTIHICRTIREIDADEAYREEVDRRVSELLASGEWDNESKARHFVEVEIEEAQKAARKWWH